MLNAHFLNTSEDLLKGESVLDVKFAEVDPSRKIMSLYTNETNAEMRFPTEMCIGIGFFLSDGTSSPTCLNGEWLEGVKPNL